MDIKVLDSASNAEWLKARQLLWPQSTNKDHSGRGLGKELVDYVSDWSKEKGYNEIASDILLSNVESISKHESWGFEETERVVYMKKKL